MVALTNECSDNNILWQDTLVAIENQKLITITIIVHENDLFSLSPERRVFLVTLIL